MVKHPDVGLLVYFAARAIRGVTLFCGPADRVPKRPTTMALEVENKGERIFDRPNAIRVPTRRRPFHLGAGTGGSAGVGAAIRWNKGRSLPSDFGSASGGFGKMIFHRRRSSFP